MMCTWHCAMPLGIGRMTSYHNNPQTKQNSCISISRVFDRCSQLVNNLLNLGLKEVAAESVKEYGYSLDEILEQAEEPGLGNGGLGGSLLPVIWSLFPP